GGAGGARHFVGPYAARARGVPCGGHRGRPGDRARSGRGDEPRRAPGAETNRPRAEPGGRARTGWNRLLHGAGMVPILSVSRARARAGHFAPRLGLTLALIYAVLLAAEVTLWRLQPTNVLRTMGRGLYVVRDGRVSLTPGFRTHFDDGYAHGDIAINSLG